MGRRPRISTKAPLPPPLPPGQRTVGQLVAESIRFYGSHFWRSLLLGLPPAGIAVGFAELGRVWRYVLSVTAGAVLLTVCFVAACALVAPERPPKRALTRAFALGLLIYLPVPFLAAVFILPAIAWLAYVGLAVPVAVIEAGGLRSSLSRGIALARADFVHAMGSLATLTIVAFLSQAVLFFVLRGGGQATRGAAGFLAALIISPLLFIGASLLYFDQAARAVGSGHPEQRRRDAEVRASDHAHAAGRPDAEGEPGPAA